MKYSEFFSTIDLESTLLVGYYGGGNYGDELLLEIILRMLDKQRVQNASFYYLNKRLLSRYHHASRFTPVFGAINLVKAILGNRSIIIGGGGLWGLDANRKVFIMSFGAWVSKVFLRKRVYLIGVGYYGSTNRLGHISAWFAAKAADSIIVRDSESLQRFSRFNKQVSQDTDMAFMASQIDLSEYDKDLGLITRQLNLANKMVYVSLREFKQSTENTQKYEQALAACFGNNPQTQFVVSLLDPPSYYPAGQSSIHKWKDMYANVQILDTTHNPLILLRFFQASAQRWLFITPQFHAIITAILCNIPYMPIAYDNKVLELLKERGGSMIDIRDITPAEINVFIKDWVS
jgi:polysaccharide pyruvyl transferase WcaK-like protein